MDLSFKQVNLFHVENYYLFDKLPVVWGLIMICFEKGGSHVHPPCPLDHLSCFLLLLESDMEDGEQTGRSMIYLLINLFSLFIYYSENVRCCFYVKPIFVSLPVDNIIFLHSVFHAHVSVCIHWTPRRLPKVVSNAESAALHLITTHVS